MIAVSAWTEASSEEAAESWLVLMSDRTVAASRLGADVCACGSGFAPSKVERPTVLIQLASPTAVSSAGSGIPPRGPVTIIVRGVGRFGRSRAISALSARKRWEASRDRLEPFHVASAASPAKIASSAASLTATDCPLICARPVGV